MSARADHHGRPDARRGVALLLALATLVVVALCVVGLWHTRAGTLRSDRLRAARLRLDSRADSMLALGVDAVAAGVWRALPHPGTALVLRDGHAGRDTLSTRLARVGWSTVLVQGLARGRSGVAAVTARADRRLLIPLETPMAMPSAALTGRRVWDVDPYATVDLGSATADEMRCRAGTVPALAAVDTVAVSLDASQVVLLDPDTVRAPLVGVFRLIRDRIRRPMVVEGMVESVTGLLVGADLQIVGVLVVQGSVQPAGGRLHVTGAVITRDSGGAGSVLGNGDRVRYDACAIRRAVERATRPAPAAMWSAEGRP